MGIESLSPDALSTLQAVQPEVMEAFVPVDTVTEFDPASSPAIRLTEADRRRAPGSVALKDAVNSAEDQPNFTHGTRYDLTDEELADLSDDPLLLQALALTHRDLYDQHGEPIKFADWKEMIETIVEIRGDEEAVIYAANRRLTERGLTDFIRQDGFSFTPNKSGIAYIDKAIQEKLPGKEPNVMGQTDSESTITGQ